MTVHCGIATLSLLMVIKTGGRRDVVTVLQQLPKQYFAGVFCG
jgi:hypothetical protein